MKRRSLLAGVAAASMACPAIAGRTQTLTMIPQVALNSIDPVWTSSQIARNMGYMVFDQLYGRDEAMNAHPQMVESDLMEDGAKRWTLKLRENLWWHDPTCPRKQPLPICKPPPIGGTSLVLIDPKSPSR